MLADSMTDCLERLYWEFRVTVYHLSKTLLKDRKIASMVKQQSEGGH